TVQAHDYRANLIPQGQAPMELRPETALGNFYNEQNRDASSYQVISSVSGTRTSLGGLHLYKAGVDLMHSAYDAWNVSRDVSIEASDGQLVRRLEFSEAPRMQHATSTDVALFAQDRFQIGSHTYTEFGARLDRDGITGRFNVTPRAGAAWRL